MGLLEGKLGVVFGVANRRSIAWAIAQAWHDDGARLAFTYQGERLKENVEELTAAFGSDVLLMPCDVTRDEEITAVFDRAGKEYGHLTFCCTRWLLRPAMRWRAGLQILPGKHSGRPWTSAPIRSWR